MRNKLFVKLTFLRSVSFSIIMLLSEFSSREIDVMPNTTRDRILSAYGWSGNRNYNCPNMFPNTHTARPPSYTPNMGGQNYYWVNSARGHPVPPNAVVCGRDRDGSEIYLGLAHHCGEELPAKIIPRRNEAYVCYSGNEIRVSNYRVLAEKKLVWVHNMGGRIPPNAVPAGRTASGETLYVGRRRVEGDAMTVGKVHPSHGCLYVPYGGREMNFKDYEILVYQ